MTFDATVTVGDVLTMIGGAYLLLSLVVFVVGSRWFPSKAEVKALRDHVDQQVVSTRQDVQNAVGKLELVLTKEAGRLERAITDCTTEARQAREQATGANHLADRATLVATNSEKVLDAHIQRVERMVESLLSRPRSGESNHN